MIETQEQLEAMLHDGTPYKFRREGAIVPEGLSLTQTHIAEYWWYRETDTIALLRIETDGGKKTFERFDAVETPRNPG